MVLDRRSSGRPAELVAAAVFRVREWWWRHVSDRHLFRLLDRYVTVRGKSVPVQPVVLRQRLARCTAEYRQRDQPPAS